MGKKPFSDGAAGSRRVCSHVHRVYVVSCRCGMDESEGPQVFLSRNCQKRVTGLTASTR